MKSLQHPASSDALDQELERALGARGVRWPAPLVFLQDVGSTNDFVKHALSASRSDWLVARAARQTGGRGRLGRTWHSAEGNLFLSIGLPVGLPAERLSLLPLACGLAVEEAVAELGVPVRLKWPNDLWLGERKLAGLLLEATSGAAGLESLVLGLGVNLESAPATTDPPAVCLSEALGAACPSAATVAAAVLARIRGWYDLAASGDPEAVAGRFQERAVPWWGRIVEVHSGPRRLRGRALGVDATGALLLEIDGQTQRVLSGDARALRPGESR